MKVIGRRELESKLLGAVTRNDLRVALRAGAAVFREGARRRAPIRKTKGKRRAGQLRRSIRTVERRAGTGQVHFAVAATGKGFYGKFIEQGWLHGGRLGRKNPRRVRVPGRPFMGPTFDADESRAMDAVVAKLAERVARK